VNRFIHTYTHQTTCTSTHSKQHTHKHKHTYMYSHTHTYKHTHRTAEQQRLQGSSSVKPNKAGYKLVASALPHQGRPKLQHSTHGHLTVYAHTHTHTAAASASSCQAYIAALTYVGLARAMYTYIKCIYGIFGREITKKLYGHTRCIHTVLANPTHMVTHDFMRTHTRQLAAGFKSTLQLSC